MNHYPYERKEYTIAQIAYLAGIIDGEGSIYIGNFRCHPKTKVPYYQTNIQVTNTDKPLIDWLYNTFGGLVSKRTSKQHAKNSRKQAYIWTATGERVTHLCELILPYLIVKIRQCEIMLKMRATFTPNHCTKGKQGIQPLNADIIELRQSLMNEMRSLHIRIHSYKNHGYLPRVAMPQLLEEV
jgi:LAGLIDADG DNA endonuclease family protein